VLDGDLVGLENSVKKKTHRRIGSQTQSNRRTASRVCVYAPVRLCVLAHETNGE